MLLHGCCSHGGGAAGTIRLRSGHGLVSRDQAAAAQTNTAWPASPEHQANSTDGRLAAAGGCPRHQAFAANGDARQPTAAGLTAWRKADNNRWTAFTDGYRTSIDGPTGRAKCLNTERFARGANPGDRPLAR